MENRGTNKSFPKRKNLLKNVWLAFVTGFPLTTCNLRMIVHAYLNKIGKNVSRFQNNVPGEEWALNFLKRHSNLNGSNIKRSRAAVDKDVLKHWRITSAAWKRLLVMFHQPISGIMTSQISLMTQVGKSHSQEGLQISGTNLQQLAKHIFHWWCAEVLLANWFHIMCVSVHKSCGICGP